MIRSPGGLPGREVNIDTRLGDSQVEKEKVNMLAWGTPGSRKKSEYARQGDSRVEKEKVMRSPGGFPGRESKVDTLAQGSPGSRKRS